MKIVLNYFGNGIGVENKLQRENGKYEQYKLRWKVWLCDAEIWPKNSFDHNLRLYMILNRE